MATKLYFKASQSITLRLAELFNFAWPTMAALWNLRWQVRGYAETTGKKEVTDLHERFVAGSGVTSANLKVACLETTWVDQQNQFAKFLLFDLCGLYEAWLEDASEKVFASSKRQIMVKALQFPLSAVALASPGKSYVDAIAEANKTKSPAMVEFFGVVKNHQKNSWNNVEDLLIAYRYFKLSRNSIIHGGGLADAQWINAANAFKVVPFVNLGFNKSPVVKICPVGERIEVCLADVVGLSNIIHRLIVTMDAALCVSDRVEKDFVARMTLAKPKFHQSMSQDVSRRHRQIISFLGKAALPQPPKTLAIESLLKANNLVK
ncbi:hypothetical protein HDE78_000714 [Rhodanobacter sp. K2T2]|uniref:hypothetical protein n=1 Tax=Rhodanobacter sp. K2T2 TaxID=2723085 RepID=UPI0015C6E5E2|nr:hypothetical protein [Rhodanobacter sp. K2T2]NYE27768.1 hypothetical protein [Rhodanobacter sp. K2T2]